MLVPHSNSVVFGNEYYDEQDEFPLLYTNIYNNYAKNDDKLEGVCLVYRIERNEREFTSTLVQIIQIGFVDDENLWTSAGEKEDVRPYGNFVNNGGTLICTWSHFTDTSLKEDINNYRLNIVSHPLTEILSDVKAEFVTDYTGRNEIKACKNISAKCEILSTSDSGTPLVCSFNRGCGKIILVNTLYYPGNKAVYPIYESIIKSESNKILAGEEERIECNEDVQYTIFNQNDGTKHIYFTAVDWYNSSEEERCAKLITADSEYIIKIPFGTIVKLVTDGKTAVWPENDFSEIISINGDSFNCQGEGN